MFDVLLAIEQPRWHVSYVLS